MRDAVLASITKKKKSKIKEENQEKKKKGPFFSLYNKQKLDPSEASHNKPRRERESLVSSLSREIKNALGTLAASSSLSSLVRFSQFSSIFNSQVSILIKCHAYNPILCSKIHAFSVLCDCLYLQLKLSSLLNAIN